MVNHKNPDDLIIQIHPGPGEAAVPSVSALGSGKGQEDGAGSLGAGRRGVQGHPYPPPGKPSAASLRPVPSLRPIVSATDPPQAVPCPPAACGSPSSHGAFSASLCVALLACSPSRGLHFLSRLPRSLLGCSLPLPAPHGWIPTSPHHSTSSWRSAWKHECPGDLGPAGPPTPYTSPPLRGFRDHHARLGRQ